jgi:ABC-type dipeptide/oligopeptide/nickel transport system permease component
MIRLSPGDPVLIYAGEERDPESLAQIRRSLGLDEPLPVQYLAWLGRALQGDLGRSIRTRQPVTEAITERLPATAELGLAALTISVVVSLCVGTVSALRRDSVIDLATTGLALAGVSLPNFFLGIVLILLFTLAIRIFPPGGYTPFVNDPVGNLHRLVLPAITLSAATLAVNLRQVRSSLIDVFNQDYIRTARAKGLANHEVVIRHSLKNALIPVVTLIGIQAGQIIEGAIITESIFFWPGVGRLALESIAGRDYPVVQAIVLISALSFMTTTLLVDVLYAWLDPRVSYGRGGSG